MDFIPHARDLYDGPVLDDDVVGQCDTCDNEITGKQVVFVDRDTTSTPGGGTVTSCRMRCATCEAERRR